MLSVSVLAIFQGCFYILIIDIVASSPWFPATRNLSYCLKSKAISKTRCFCHTNSSFIWTLSWFFHAILSYFSCRLTFLYLIPADIVVAIFLFPRSECFCRLFLFSKIGLKNLSASSEFGLNHPTYPYPIIVRSLIWWRKDLVKRVARKRKNISNQTLAQKYYFIELGHTALLNSRPHICILDEKNVSPQTIKGINLKKKGSVCIGKYF